MDTIKTDNDLFRKKIIITDLDGTISDCTHRLKYYRKNDYFKFNELGSEDLPITPIVNILRNCKSEDTDIVVVTARDEYHRPATLDWLKRYDIPCDNLLMRPSDDNRYDDEVKLDLFERNYEKEDVWFVLEDRQMVVNMWRSLGLTCLQPAPGDF